MAAELRAAVSEEAFEPEDRRDRFEAIDEFDFELAEPRDPSRIENYILKTANTDRNAFWSNTLPSSSPSDG